MRPCLAGAVLAVAVVLPALEVARSEAPPGVLEKVPPLPPVGTDVRACRRPLLPAQGDKTIMYCAVLVQVY